MGDERETSLITTSLRAGSEIDDDVAVVVSTSGTTGEPKGALLTSGRFDRQCGGNARQAGRSRAGGCLRCPPTMSPVSRCWCAALSPDSRRSAISASLSAAELVSAVDSLGSGRRYVSLVAAQLDKSLGDPAASAALASMDAVLIGGGPMPASVAERASAADISVVRTYGMSETAGGCVYDGLPLDGVRMRIDDGRVVLGGATLAKGYRNPVDPDPFVEPGWFRTDDVGAVDDSGVLRVLGRVDDAISTGGLTVLPQLVEAAVASHPGWPNAWCSALPTSGWDSGSSRRRRGARKCAPDARRFARPRRSDSGHHRGAEGDPHRRRDAASRHRQGGPAGAGGPVRRLVLPVLTYMTASRLHRHGRVRLCSRGVVGVLDDVGHCRCGIESRRANEHQASMM